MKKTILTLALCCSVPVIQLWAQPTPPAMNYQAQFLGAGGAPLPTGDYTVNFSVYDAADSGNLIWGPQILDGTSGTGHGPKASVVDGYLNTLVGPTDTAGRALANAFTGPLRFLEVKVGTNDPIQPRQQILTAPYAFAASTAANAAIASTAVGVNAGAVDSTALAAAAVTTAKLAAGSVTSEKIAAGAVSIENLAQELANMLVPPGTILPYGGTTAPPGYLMCDGQQYNTNTYSKLAAVLGTAYGGGSLTFNVPDLRGMFLRGADDPDGSGTNFTSAGRDPDRGSRTAMMPGGNSGNNPGSIQTSTFSSHNHTVTVSGTTSSYTHSHTINGNYGTGIGGTGSITGDAAIKNDDGRGYTEETASNTHAHSFSWSGPTFSSGGNETRPINAYVNFIIKY